nr:hypothetical protein [Tanacetum cinerariifolium]
MKKGRTVVITAEDMQKIRNDVKARTTLLLALPDEHQLRFSKDDLDTMSLDDVYNHLKVYEPEVQKKLKVVEKLEIYCNVFWEMFLPFEIIHKLHEAIIIRFDRFPVSRRELFPFIEELCLLLLNWNRKIWFSWSSNHSPYVRPILNGVNNNLAIWSTPCKSDDTRRPWNNLSSFAELEAKFLEQFHNYQQLHRFLQEDREEAKWIAHSKALSPAADEPASLFRGVKQGEAFLTVSSLDAGHDMENIAKTSALPHDSSPRVTSFNADEGNMQQRIHKLMELYTSLQRQQSQMAAKIKDQDLDISGLKARVKSLKDKERRGAEPTQEDAPITRGIMEIWEELGAKKSTELGSNDTEEMVNVLCSMEAANFLTSRVAAASVSLVAGVSATGVPTVSGSFPTVNVIFTTASVVTPYTRRPRGITIRSSQYIRSPIIRAKDRGKQKVIEFEVPKKRKLQEQIDAQVAKEMEKEFVKESQRVSEQLARDFKIARLHAEEELKIMIEGLDKSNEVIAKHLREYEQAEADLSVGEKIELINELVKYQDHHDKILKYQAQQSKPLSKKEQREFYMSVLRSHAGWKTKHFRGMTLEQIKELFIPVWKQLEDFMLMSSKKEGKRVKKQGPKIDQGSSIRMKTSENVYEEELNGMMQLVPLEEVYVKALQVKHPIIDWEIHSEGKREYWKIIRLGGHTTVYQLFIDMLKQFDKEDLHQQWTLVKETLSIRQATKDKEKELWVELKRLFKPDFEDQLWTHN